MSLPWFVPRGMLLSDTPATRNMATPQMESRARPVLWIVLGRPRSQIYATLAPGFASAIRHRNVRATNETDSLVYTKISIIIKHHKTVISLPWFVPRDMLLTDIPSD